MVGFAYAMYGMVETQQELEKKRILDEWEKSRNYPRKKKKKVRKHLQLDWNFANWNPFNN